jgi:hypothetical protein
MNTEMIRTPALSSTTLISRIRYRHGFPFTTSIVLAVVTTAWPIVRESHFHEGTSIWTFAILATISTAFALLCGGRFRTFFIAIAVTPPFLFVYGWILFQRSAMLYVPIKAVVEYFFYFVVAPIFLVWIVATLFNGDERDA